MGDGYTYNIVIAMLLLFDNFVKYMLSKKGIIRLEINQTFCGFQSTLPYHRSNSNLGNCDSTLKM